MLGITTPYTQVTTEVTHFMEINPAFQKKY